MTTASVSGALHKGENMSFPQSHTVKFHIAAYLHRNPNANADEVCKSMPGRRSNYVRTQINELIVDLMVTKGEDGGLMVCRNLGRHIDQLEIQKPEPLNVVESRTAPKFRPGIQPKNQFWNNQRFQECRREIYYVTGGIGFAPFRGSSL